jgi:hypothetical protein
MRRVTLLALAMTTLSGCASVEPDMAWSVNETRAEGVKLVLGREGTDNVRLVATCPPHSGAVRLTVVGREDEPAVVELRSGKLSKRYAGAGVADEETLGAVDIQFQLSADDPVLARVADTGELTVLLGGRRMVLPNGFAQAHDFMRLCRR